MFSVSQRWNEDILDNCIEKIIDYRGKSVPKAESGIRLITARNVRSGFIDYSHEEYIPEEVYDEWMDRGIPQGDDILFTTEAPLGMIAAYPHNARFALGQRLVAIRVDNLKLHAGYLLQYFLSPIGQDNIFSKSSGSTAIGIKQSELRKILIPLPPLDEQQKIAEILSTWDEAIGLTEQLIAALGRRKQALMQLLLTGEVRFAEFESIDEEVVILQNVSEFITKGATPTTYGFEFINEGVPFFVSESVSEA